MIEENCGQIENLLNGQDQYPVDFPCILVSSPETEWKSLKPDVQRGSSTLVVSVAFRTYEDTFNEKVHLTDTAERDNLVHRVALAVAAFRPSDNSGDCSTMTRVSSRGIALAGGLKVYESVWAFRQTEYLS
jgi:hypothetical protein